MPDAKLHKSAQDVCTVAWKVWCAGLEIKQDGGLADDGRGRPAAESSEFLFEAHANAPPSLFVVAGAFRTASRKKNPRREGEVRKEWRQAIHIFDTPREMSDTLRNFSDKERSCIMTHTACVNARSISEEAMSKTKQTTQARRKNMTLSCWAAAKDRSFLPGRFQRQGMRVAVVEQRWIGGSCPNIACLPSKNIIHSAKVASYFARAEEFGIQPRATPWTWKR